MMDALDEVCQACQKRNARILVDAESQHYQKGIEWTTIALMRKYNRDGHALIFNTYQAYLKSTPQRLGRDLALAAKEGWTAGVKVVRGAYIATDKRSLIHDTKEETDAAYNYIAQSMLRRDEGLVAERGRFPSANLLLATHNKYSALEALKLYRERTRAGLPTVPVQFAQLQGMADNEGSVPDDSWPCADLNRWLRAREAEAVCAVDRRNLICNAPRAPRSARAGDGDRGSSA